MNAGQRGQGDEPGLEARGPRGDRWETGGQARAGLATPREASLRAHLYPAAGSAARPIRAVLFDLHDTLVKVPGDNLAARRRAAHRAFEEWPGAPGYAEFEAADEQVRQALRRQGEGQLRDFGVTHRVRLVARALLAASPPDDFVARVVDAYVGAWIETLAPLPGTAATLAALRPRYRLALVTDFGHAPGIRRILARFGLTGCFAPIVVSEEVGHTKPHPAMFRAALDGLGMSPAECVFVGDNPVCDVAGARQAGIRPVLVDPLGRHPEHEGDRIADLRELPALLARLEGADEATWNVEPQMDADARG